MDRKRKKQENVTHNSVHEEKQDGQKKNKETDTASQEYSGPESRGTDTERRGTERRSGEDRRKDFRRESDKAKAEIGAFNDPRVDVLKQELESVNEEVGRYKVEIDTLKDLLQRRQADFENYKKRTIKFQEEQKKFSIKDLALDIITINDDLHRAVEASMNFGVNGGSCEEGHKSFVDGVVMISKQIEDMLGKYHVIEIPSLNEKFDPTVHEAVEIELSNECDVDMVAKVYQKGFCIDDLVIRSSKVKVAKAQKDFSQARNDQEQKEAHGEPHETGGSGD